MKRTSDFKELVNFSSGCTHKHLIKNSKGEEIYIPCGVCKYCRLNRADHLTLLCQLEEHCSEFCYFFTLTYSPEHHNYINLQHMYTDNYLVDYNNSDLRRIIENHFEKNNPSRSVHIDSKELVELTYTINSENIKRGKRLLPGLPVLNKYDLIRFIKRVRNEVKKISDEKIRYFAVGEYGPKGLKPHFHGCIYFNDSAIAEKIVSIISKKWKYGYTDCSKSRSSVSSYIASYVNSFSSFPDVYKSVGCTPFMVHSVKFGQGFFENSRKEIYENGFDYFKGRSYEVLGKVREFVPTMQMLSNFYPRCKNFGNLTITEQGHLYNLISVFKNYHIYDIKKSLSDNAINIAGWALCNSFNDVSITIRRTLNLADINFDDFMHDCYQYQTSLEEDIFFDIRDTYTFNFVYSLLLFSKNFNKIFRSFIKVYPFASRMTFIEHINKFYNDYSLYQLNEFYASLDKMSLLCESADDDDSLYYYYDNASDLGLYIPDNPFIRFSKDKTELRFQNSIKHKEHNDVNSILEMRYLLETNDDVLPF